MEKEETGIIKNDAKGRDKMKYFSDLIKNSKPFSLFDIIPSLSHSGANSRMALIIPDEPLNYNIPYSKQLIITVPTGTNGRDKLQKLQEGFLGLSSKIWTSNDCYINFSSNCEFVYNSTEKDNNLYTLSYNIKITKRGKRC